jgi:iron complex transport system substrate-binding protein
MGRSDLNICFIWLAAISLFAVISCTNSSTIKNKNSEALSLSAFSPAYATGFKVFETDEYKILEIYLPWDSLNAAQRIYLHEDSSPNIDFQEDGIVLNVPLDNMVCFSATHLSFADALGLVDKIAGVASTDFVVSEEFQHLVESGQIREVGIGDHFMLEELIQMHPEIIMVSPQKGQSFDPLVNAGLNLVLNGDYLEPSPLGRAEWIKLMGLLFAKENEAMQIFDSISKEYENLKKLTEQVAHRPTVLSGKQYSGFWSLPGGQSYIARFIADAGGYYLYADNPETGSKTLEFESVYERGIEADYWRFLVYSSNEFSYDLLVQEDVRYADFLAVKNHKVFVCNTLKSPYFQKGLLEPQIILADYIRILHPEILPQHQSVYYHLLP